MSSNDLIPMTKELQALCKKYGYDSINCVGAKGTKHDYISWGVTSQNKLDGLARNCALDSLQLICVNMESDDPARAAKANAVTVKELVDMVADTIQATVAAYNKPTNEVH